MKKLPEPLNTTEELLYGIGVRLEKLIGILEKPVVESTKVVVEKPKVIATAKEVEEIVKKTPTPKKEVKEVEQKRPRRKST